MKKKPKSCPDTILSSDLAGFLSRSGVAKTLIISDLT